MVYKAPGNHIFDFLLNLLEVNDNLGGCHFGCMEYFRPMFEFVEIISRNLINNLCLIQYYPTSEYIEIKRNKHNY